MGILSSIFKFLKKWWWLILLIVLVIWIFFPVLWGMMTTFFSSIWTALGPVVSAFKGLGLLKGLAVGFGLVAVIDPDAAKGIVDNVTDVADHVIDSGVGLVTGAVSTPLLLIGGGVLAWWLLTRDKSKDEEQASPEANPTYQEYPA